MITTMKIEKTKVLSDLFHTKIVAVIRIDHAADLVDVSKALIEGGVKFVEITTTVPNALEAIEQTVIALGDSVHIGAGTILTASQASDAISAGADYIVSPVLNQEVVCFCNEAEIAVMPGCMTPTEVYNAHCSGADVVKIFPADLGGPTFFKNLKGPLPHIRIMPTGNVNLSNVNEFIQAGACAAGVGGALVSKQLITEKNYRQITENAIKFIRAVS